MRGREIVCELEVTIVKTILGKARASYGVHQIADIAFARIDEPSAFARQTAFTKDFAVSEACRTVE